MKNKNPLERFDPFSVLALFGVVLVLLFECIFIFELYQVEYARIEPLLPSFARPAVEQWMSRLDQGVVVLPVEGATDDALVAAEIEEPAEAGIPGLVEEVAEVVSVEGDEPEVPLAEAVEVSEEVSNVKVDEIGKKVEPVKLEEAQVVKPVGLAKSLDVDMKTAVVAPVSPVVIVERAPTTDAEMEAILALQEGVAQKKPEVVVKESPKTIPKQVKKTVPKKVVKKAPVKVVEKEPAEESVKKRRRRKK